MTDGAAPVSERQGTLALGATFAVLILLTSLELVVLGLGMERAARITTLAGLMMAKVGLVLLVLMHARQNRRSARLLLTAIVFGAGVAVVLILETAYRVTIT
jgi:cytochrome c oxidase subunit IV